MNNVKMWSRRMGEYLNKNSCLRQKMKLADEARNADWRHAYWDARERTSYNRRHEKVAKPFAKQSTAYIVVTILAALVYLAVLFLLITFVLLHVMSRSSIEVLIISGIVSVPIWTLTLAIRLIRNDYIKFRIMKNSIILHGYRDKWPNILDIIEREHQNRRHDLPEEPNPNKMYAKF